MKKFKNIKGYLQAITALPEVRALVDGHPFGEILGVKLPDALANAFTAWYDARTYKALCPLDKDNAYPGDRAAFSLALKSAFFPYRYAWPKQTIDRALEAVARTLPEAEEVDGYPECEPLVQIMRRRTKIAEPESNPIGTLLNALRALRDHTEEREGNEPGAASAPGKDPVLEALGKRFGGEATPGCDCTRCSAIRARKEGEDSTKPTDGPAGDEGLPEPMKRLLKHLTQDQTSHRERILGQAEQLRAAIANGTLQEVVDATLNSLPNGLGAANVQAGLTIISELGFGDVVPPYAAAVRANGKFPGFTATPTPGSPEEERYNHVLRLARRQIGV